MKINVLTPSFVERTGSKVASISFNRMSYQEDIIEPVVESHGTKLVVERRSTFNRLLSSSRRSQKIAISDFAFSLTSLKKHISWKRRLVTINTAITFREKTTNSSSTRSPMFEKGDKQAYTT